MPRTFNQMGNLAFYDGWSPHYVYFQSLLSRAWADSNPNGSWNTDLAGERAATAVSDAIAHSTPQNMTQEESIQYFLNKFDAIVSFLETAIEAERASEKAYFDQLLKDLKKTFKPEERKKITALQKLEKLIEAGKVNEDVQYDAINALVNVLMMGFNNTQALVQYEQDRVKKLDDTIKTLITNRGNQAAGLGKVAHKDLLEQQQMAERAMDKLERTITVEYATTGQLTRVDKTTGKYVLFGGKTIETTIPQAIDRVIANWVDDMIIKITSDQKFVKQLSREIGERLKLKYPVEGDFNYLSDEVQEIVIQTILAYGISDLSNIINNTVSDELIADAKKKIMKASHNDLLDTVINYDITGLNPKFGRITKETELFKDAHSLADIKDKHAVELFAAIRKLIQEEKASKKTSKSKSHSYLIEAMEKNTSTNGENTFERTENIIELIQALEKIKRAADKAKKEWAKKVKEGHDASLELSKTAKLAHDATASIKITVVNGQVEVEQSSLLQALQDDNRLSSFALKEFNPKNLQSTLNTLKSRASKILKQDIIQSLEKATFKIPENQLVSHVNKELRSLQIKINGPTLAELLTGIYFRSTGKNVAIDWNKYSGKNDSVAITIAHGKLVHKFHTTSFYQMIQYDEKNPIMQAEKRIQEAQIQLAKAYQAKIDRSVESLTKSNDMEKYSKMLTIMNTDIKADEEQDEELAQAYQNLEKETNILRAELKKHNITDFSDDQADNMIAEYLHTLQNAFYVSTTVKSANDYVNQLGFKGGTLGSNLDAQLSRLEDIFESAGVPIDPKDMDWLRSSILNCFKGSVVGEKNKHLIENYLGALAAFALFDEGGAETAIIDNFKVNIAKAIQTGKAQKIVHLYVMDDLYIKGSTVLERTLNTIKTEVIPNIEKIPATMRRGAGVVIINQASESKKFIPNRPYEQFVNGTPDPNAWEITGNRVAGQVTIQILFLAGLLDILNGINNALGKASAKTSK